MGNAMMQVASSKPTSLPKLQTNVCLACGTSGLTFVENIPIDQLADAWANDREALGGESADRKAWLDSTTRTIESSAVRFDRCEECGLEMSSPRRPWLNGLYPEDEHYPQRWEFTRCLTDFGAKPLSILELGCGAGEFLSMAESRGHKAIGVDFNSYGVETAKGRGLKAICGGFDHLREYLLKSQKELAFDAIAFFHVIEHLAEPDLLFQKLNSFARSGTRLAISCPGPDRFTGLISEQRVGTREFVDYPPHHVLRWTIPALRRFLEAHGWKVINAVEEPLDWVAASSQIGITRAMYNGYLNSPIRRRLSLVRARAQLLMEVLRRHTTGLSIYILAERSN